MSTTRSVLECRAVSSRHANTAIKGLPACCAHHHTVPARDITHDTTSVMLMSTRGNADGGEEWGARRLLRDCELLQMVVCFAGCGWLASATGAIIGGNPNGTRCRASTAQDHRTS